jgi:acyl-CoA synthetase (AMP-forming)/AMP-acid ligase II
VFFTSGTTGHPKGVQHTGRSVCAAIRMMLEAFNLPSDTVFYIHNLHSYVATIIAGVTTKIAPLKMEPHRYAREVTKAGATHAFIRPVDAFNLVIECEQKGVEFPQSLRHMYFYSAPVTTTVLRRVLAAGHPDLKVHCIYGMTEASAVAIVDGAERAAWTGEGDLVGKAWPGVEVKVSEAGVLMVRGDNVHKGYAGMDEIEWHDTGDIGRIDEHGNIILGGRAKDMLIRGHFNLYPSLYEETINRIPGVRSCAIVGVPDPVTADEAVHLYVERDPLAPDADLRSTVDAALKAGPCMIDIAARPDVIHVVDSLPKGGRSNKIDRRELRVMAAASTANASPAPAAAPATATTKG